MYNIQLILHKACWV